MTTFKGCELGPPHVCPNDPFAPGRCCFSLWGTVLACVLVRLMMRGVRLCHFLQESTLLALWWFLKIRTRLVLLWNSTLLWTSKLTDWLSPHVCPVEAQALRPAHGFSVIKNLVRSYYMDMSPWRYFFTCGQILMQTTLGNPLVNLTKKPRKYQVQQSKHHDNAHRIKRGQYIEI